jgi:glycosyltransferase involved in cell wall biosynthesis
VSQAQVTVVIPAFNCAKWIRQAVDSALNQTTPPRQIIVIDDGSIDETAAILLEYGERIQYVHQSNQGVAAARNTALAIAIGDFVAFLDADDVWHPRKLELQLRATDENPRIGLLGTGKFSWPAAEMPQWTGNMLPPLDRIDRDALAVKNYLATSSVMARREVVRRVGKFDVMLRGPEDHDYWLRAAEIADVAILPAPLTGYRWVLGSLSKRAGAMESGMHRILRKLDRRDYWRGNLLLRHRAYSYASYSSAYLHGTAGAQWTAITRLLRSLAWYPLPFRPSEAGVSFGRVRRLAVLLLRLVGLVSSDPAV